MGEGDEDGKLGRATLNSLVLADSKGLQSIAFPAISTGIFGFPTPRCARIMLEVTCNYLSGESQLQQVVFCLYDPATLAAFEKQLALFRLSETKPETTYLKPLAPGGWKPVHSQAWVDF